MDNKTYYQKCPTCGQEKHFEMFDTHHIVPRSDGGTGKKENLITICKDCHYKIHHPNWKDGDIKQFEEEYKEGIQNNLFSEGYGILPRKVMLDRSISSTAKLLYVELSSLCAAKGYCWANNKYLSKVLHVSMSTISASITQLEKYIIIEDRTSFKRRIWVHMLQKQPSRKLEGQQQPSRKLEGHHRENSRVNHRENSIHNIINNNIINNNTEEGLTQKMQEFEKQIPEEILKNKTDRFIADVKEQLRGQSLNKSQVEELKHFVSYWTEPNKSRTKLKWELRETWDTKRRIVNWFRNNKSFNKTNKRKISNL
jgi:hypothetical protein